MVPAQSRQSLECPGGDLKTLEEPGLMCRMSPEVVEVLGLKPRYVGAIDPPAPTTPAPSLFRATSP